MEIDINKLLGKTVLSPPQPLTLLLNGAPGSKAHSPNDLGSGLAHMAYAQLKYFLLAFSPLLSVGQCNINLTLADNRRRRNTRTTNLTIGLSENFNMFPLSQKMVEKEAHYHNLSLACINSDLSAMCAKSCQQECFFILSFSPLLFTTRS